MHVLCFLISVFLADVKFHRLNISMPNSPQEIYLSLVYMMSNSPKFNHLKQEKIKKEKTLTFL